MGGRVGDIPNAFCARGIALHRKVRSGARGAHVEQICVVREVLTCLCFEQQKVLKREGLHTMKNAKCVFPKHRNTQQTEECGLRGNETMRCAEIQI